MSRYFSQLYDPAMHLFERVQFQKIRRELVGKAKGRVLEIGAGTGLNFPYYYQAKRVDAIDPDGDMMEKALKRQRAALVPIDMQQMNAEQLHFPDDTFDSVVATLVFCTIPDPVQAISEIIRVMKPGGRLVVFEHVRMEQPLLSFMQDRLTPIWKQLCDGCHLNRDTLTLLKAAPLTLQNIRMFAKGLFFSAEAICVKNNLSQ